MYYYHGLKSAKLSLSTVKEEIAWTKLMGANDIMEDFIEDFNHIFPNNAVSSTIFKSEDGFWDRYRHDEAMFRGYDIPVCTGTPTRSILILRSCALRHRRHPWKLSRDAITFA